MSHFGNPKLQHCAQCGTKRRSREQGTMQEHLWFCSLYCYTKFKEARTKTDSICNIGPCHWLMGGSSCALGLKKYKIMTKCPSHRIPKEIKR